MERRVVGPLLTMRDVAEAWDARSGGGGVKLMPSMWHEGSYAELERVLHLLRDREWVLWWHPCAPHVWCGARLA